MPVNDSRRLLTTAEAADYLRIGKSTLRKYVRNGSVYVGST